MLTAQREGYEHGVWRVCARADDCSMVKMRSFLILLLVLTGVSMWAGAPAQGQVEKAPPASIPGIDNVNAGDAPFPQATPKATATLTPKSALAQSGGPALKVPPVFLEVAEQKATNKEIESINKEIESINQTDRQTGRRLALRFIPVPGNGTLLVFDRAKAGPKFRYHLLPFKEPLTVNNLKLHILENQDKVFVGIYRIDEGSYLMLFYGKQ